MHRKASFAFISILMAATFLPVHASSAKSPLPLAVGNRWEYAISQIGVMSAGEGEASKSYLMRAEGTCVEEVISIREQRPNGETVYEHRSTTKTEAGLNTEASESTEDTLMLVSEKGVSILASKSSGLDGLLSDEWEEYDPPLVMFSAGLVPGKKWRIGTVRDRSIRMPMVARVSGTETVTVPAGTFRNCVKVYVTCGRVTGTMGSGQDKATIKKGKSVTTVWIHPGTGVVKENTILQAKMQFESEGPPLMLGTQRETKELLPGYRAE